MASLYWTDLAGQTVSVRFDSSSSETLEDTVTITDHPVEKGINVTDHAKDEPVTVLVEGFVSNVPMPGMPGVIEELQEVDVQVSGNPNTGTIELDIPQPRPALNPLDLATAGITAAARSLGFGLSRQRATYYEPGTLSKQTLRFKGSRYSDANRNRPREVYELLLDAKDQKALITVVTPFRDIGNLLIQRIATPRSPQEGFGLRFQVDLREIRVVASETVQVPVPLETRGAAKTNAGAQSQTKKETTPEMESTLHQIIF